LLKRDYIPHKIQPVAGYGDLARAGEELVRPMQTTNGGSGGVVVCLGVGGLVDLGEILALSNPEDEVEDMGGVEIWVFDARRPWNLGNVFGGQAGMGQAMAEIDANARRRGRGVDKGCITPAYTSKNGGIVVYDDGDIEEELRNEREAYYALLEMPDVDDDDDDDASDDDAEDDAHTGSKKRKSWSGREDDEDSDGDEPPHQRRRSNSVCNYVLYGSIIF
jgi:cell division control protein 45